MCGPNAEACKDEYESRVHLNEISQNVIVGDFPVEFMGRSYVGKIAYYENGPKPLVLVFPNYAGLKQFDIDQAVFMALLGYVAVAVDLYGDSFPPELRNPGSSATEKDILRHLQGAFSAYNHHLKNPREWRALMKFYLYEALKMPVVDETRAGAIGYCFGGQCILEMVRSGADIQGGVSFHGLLQSKPLLEPLCFPTATLPLTELLPESVAPNDYNTECKLHFFNAEHDDHVSDSSFKEFKEEMRDVKDWQFTTISGVYHGFALSRGVWSNKYDVKADRKSTRGMIEFFSDLWGDFTPSAHVAVNACGTPIAISQL